MLTYTVKHNEVSKIARNRIDIFVFAAGYASGIPNIFKNITSILSDVTQSRIKSSIQ